MTSTKLQADFEVVRGHCIDIRCSYNTYTDLYNEDNRLLLSQTAATFFTDLAAILHRDWVLQVCKIMDPESIKRKGLVLENLTIKLISSQLTDQKLMTSEIGSVATDILAYGSKLTPARNKRIAHFDRESQVSDCVLGETSESELEQFLQNIQEYCDLVGIAVGLGPLDFTSSGCAGDVLDLIKVLKRGANA